MKVTYSTNAWGKVVTHCCGANNVNYAYYLSTGADEEAIKEIAGAGYDSVEMFDGNLLAYEEDTEKLKSVFKQYGVTLKAIYSAANFIYEEILEEEYEKILRTCRIAERLGAKHLVLGGGAIPSCGPSDTDYEKLGRALNEIAVRAGNLGLTTSFHPHMGSLVESPDQLDKVMASTEVWLCPDCGHIALGGGDPYRVTEKYIDRIKYFHLKGVTGEGRFCTLDKGTIDFGPILNLLKEYDGRIELAVECDAESKTPGEDAKVTLGYLEKCGVS